MVRHRAMVTLMERHARMMATRPLPVVPLMERHQLATIIGMSRHAPMRGDNRRGVQRQGHRQCGMLGAIAMRPTRIRHRAILSNQAMAGMLIGQHQIPGASRIIMARRAPLRRATIAIGTGPQRVRPRDRPKAPSPVIQPRRVPAVTNTPIPAERAATAMMTIGVMMMSGFSPVHPS